MICIEITGACSQGELYRSLMRVALKQQDEIKSIIQETIVAEEESVLQCAASFQFTGAEMTSLILRAWYTMRQKKVNHFSFVCIFLMLDRNW